MIKSNNPDEQLLVSALNSMCFERFQLGLNFFLKKELL